MTTEGVELAIGLAIRFDRDNRLDDGCEDRRRQRCTERCDRRDTGYARHQRAAASGIRASRDRLRRHGDERRNGLGCRQRRHR